ncbi:hypothetical protein [Desulfosporosinus sp. FKB]|uniref:hypothetical protein n=1 Tax=Desulfosporosinus sp. FKB TaxID=1969835 RepID=UPI000B4A5059|nr:hypothetical protein [Desulfosporosinus sp. FKB]
MNNSRLIKLFKFITRGLQLKDSIAIGLFGGLIGTLFIDVSNFILWKKNRTEMLYAHLGASMFMRPYRTNQKKNIIIGQFFHLITGATLGLPLFYILKKTGRDYLILKGGFCGLLTWGTLYSFGIKKGFYSAKPHLTKTHYSYLFHNFLYGITSALSMVWLAHPSVFPSAQAKQNEDKILSSNFTDSLSIPSHLLTQPSTDVENHCGIH